MTRSARDRRDQNGIARRPSAAFGAGTPLLSSTVHTGPLLPISRKNDDACAALTVTQQN